MKLTPFALPGFLSSPKALMRAAALGIVLALGFTGCQSTHYQTGASSAADSMAKSGGTPSEKLREGDVIKIIFPGAPDLNDLQTIRRDGKISLRLVGEIDAAGMTPSELETNLVKLYSSQLLDKEVHVTVQSSSFPVYVTGAVLRPGKIASNEPLTALRAIMEAGGPDYTRANLKGVIVTRNAGGKTQHFRLNLRDVLSGNKNDSFYLQPSDIVYVPERFQFF